MLRLRGKLVPIEIKLGRAAPRLQGLLACMSDLDLPRGYVVASVPEPVALAPKVQMLGLDILARTLRLVPARGRTA